MYSKENKGPEEVRQTAAQLLAEADDPELFPASNKTNDHVVEEINGREDLPSVEEARLYAGRILRDLQSAESERLAGTFAPPMHERYSLNKTPPEVIVHRRVMYLLIVGSLVLAFALMGLGYVYSTKNNIL
mmetsp:Transcript_19094/g.44488  ORF Transcript_19094/g.44488 Transcript_19094/m.44488 type:complete len:131 (-) Transcript_19094:107-499(-)